MFAYSCDKTSIWAQSFTDSLFVFAGLLTCTKVDRMSTILCLEGIHIIVNSNIADIIIGKYGLYQYSAADLFKLGIGGFILGFG